MEVPKLDKAERYVGLYVFDFGEHAGVGFTAEEVAELLDSERYKGGQVYKIHKAYPDGRVELKGVRGELFELEMGMFFYSGDIAASRGDYEGLIQLAMRLAPPCRAKVHLAKFGDDSFAVGLIYPAEYDDEVSSWLIGGGYRTAGAAEGGIEAVGRYYEREREVLERHQLFGRGKFESRTGEKLLSNLRAAVQR